jgi:uncharacterized membrane protein YoaK (UPF0700 family)
VTSSSSSLLAEVRETLLPPPGSKDGPLPPLMVALTVVTGLVDSFSYLVLGHVFVANMTGNVVFLAFALAGAPGFSITSSLIALCFFIVGAFGAGRLAARLGENRGYLLGVCAGLQALLIGIAALVMALSGRALSLFDLSALIATLAVSMGLQNGTARKLAVPDLTTTVLTLTIVGIGADSRAAGGTGSKAGRRLTSVVAMFIGATSGAALVLRESAADPLAIAFSIVSLTGLAAWGLSRKENQVWTHGRNPS